METVTLILAKLHPVLVHFPIALILLAALVELFAAARDRSFVRPLSQHTPLLLVVGTAGATLAALSGWFNAGGQEFSGSLEDIVFYHRWLGIGMLAFAAVSLLLHWLSGMRGTTVCLSRLSLWIAAALVGATGHFGGKLVHGEDYYDEVAAALGFPQSEDGAHTMHARMSPEVVRVHLKQYPPVPIEKVSFTEEIHPIFERSCAKCHLNGKRKGEYRLDNRELALTPGESGLQPIVPGESEQSYLIHLVSALDPDSVMPNKGTRLTAEEVGLLRTWIDQGVKWDGEQKQIGPDKAPMEHRAVQVERKGARAPLDLIMAKHYEDQGITPAPFVNDRSFIRRASLDLLGLLPDPDAVEQFVSDEKPDKYERLIDELLSDNDAYAAHWLTFWNDLLRNGYTGPGFLHGGRKEITEYLHAALHQNTPFDKFTAGLLNPAGNHSASGFVRGILWWKESEEVNLIEHPAMQAAQNIGQVFLGMNLKCASCHDSFTDAWTKQDTFGIANVYATAPLETHECNQPLGEYQQARFVYPEFGSIESDTTMRLQKTFWKNPERLAVQDIDSVRPRERRLRNEAREERMASFASLVTSPDNGRFARTFVNRLWALLFGRGIIEPLDELDQLPWSADLIDWLAKDFAENSYDVKHTLRQVLTSEEYRRSTVPAAGRPDDGAPYLGPVPRRVTAEQFLDNAHRTFGTDPELKVSDVGRMLKLAENDLPKQVIFRSRKINRSTPAQEVRVPVKGVKDLWIAAVPRYKVKSRLERLAEQHLELSKKEAETLAPVSEKEAKRKEELDSFLASEEATLERLVWGDPKLLTADGDAVSLLELSPVSTVETEPTRFAEEREGQTVSIVGRSFSAGIEGKPLFAIHYKLDGRYDQFQANVGVSSLPELDEYKFQFLILADIAPRTAFVQNSDFMWMLGRPRREQVVTRRESRATTLQLLELSSGEAFASLLRDGASQLLSQKWEGREELVHYLFRSLLGRMPSGAESEKIEQIFPTLDDRAGLEDLLWTLLLHPEYQFIP